MGNSTSEKVPGVKSPTGTTLGGRGESPPWASSSHIPRDILGTQPI